MAGRRHQHDASLTKNTKGRGKAKKLFGLNLTKPTDHKRR